MSNSKEYVLDRLEADNWMTWKWQVENVLDAKGYKTIIEEPSAGASLNTEMDKQAKALIGSALGQEAKRLVVGCQHTWQMWKELTMIYENKTTFERQDLLSRLHSFKINGVKDMASQFAELKTLAGKLKLLGEPVTDYALTSIILNALPRSFDGFMVAFKLLPAEQRTLEHLMSNIVSRSKEMVSQDSKEVAMYGRGNMRGRGKPRWSDRGKEKDDKADNSPARSRACHFCKKEGHLIKDCRKLKYKEALRSKQGDGRSYPRSDGRASPGAAFMARKMNPTRSRTSSTEWIADSGATIHITKNKRWLHNYVELDDPIEIEMGDGNITYAFGYGQINSQNIVINYVYWVPSAATNLFSIREVTSNGYEARFTQDKIEITSENEIILAGRIRQGMYIMEIYPEPAEAGNMRESCLVATSIDTWHEKFGHVSHDTVLRMHRENLVDGMIVSERDQHACSSCALGKVHRCSHPTKSTEKADKPGAVIHFDTVGPVTPASLGGSRFILIGKDEFSSYKFVKMIECKADIKFRIMSLINWIELETKNSCIAIKTDNGSEFVNHELADFLKGKGISHITSAPYTPQQNGFIEREVRTVVESARTMLHKSKLPNNLWGEAVACAVYSLNRCINSRNRKQTPYELWHGKKPDVSNLRIFGEQAVILNNHHGTKFEEKGFVGSFVGYDRNFNTYRFYVENRIGGESIGKVVISSDVRFIKQSEHFNHSVRMNNEKQVVLIDGSEYSADAVDLNNNTDSQSFDWRGEIAPEVISNNVYSDSDFNSERNKSNGASSTKVKTKTTVKNNKRSVDTASTSNDQVTHEVASRKKTVSFNLPNESPHEYDIFHSFDEDTSDAEKASNVRLNLSEGTVSNIKPVIKTSNLSLITSPSKTISKRVTFDDVRTDAERLLVMVNVNEEPATYEEAISSADSGKWVEAMSEEINSLMKNDVWELVDKPENVNIVTCKWIFKIKKNTNNEIERYKARLVARGFSQVEGEDFSKTFAPVAHMTTLRMLFSFAASRKLLMKGFDVKTAFLYGDLEEKVFMEQPQGFESEGNKVCRLKRSLYGLKQAPRQWNVKFSQFLLSTNLQASENDPCLFYRREPLLIVVIYVDDGIIISSSSKLINEVLEQLKSRFEIHEVEMNSFLGFQIERNESGIFIHQSNYIKKIIERFNMKDCSIVDSPISQEVLHVEDEKLEDNVPIREAIGSLMYASVLTRPDITYAVCKVSRNVSQPTKSDWIAIKRIFRYLQGTADYGIHYMANEVEMISYCDADFAGDKSTSKSTTGAVTLLAGGSVHWRSQRQKMVVLSSTEAELVSICVTTQDIVWLRKIAIELAIIDQKPTTLHCDNQSAIKLATNEKSCQRTRHMSVKAAYPREKIEEGEIKIDYVKAEYQLADILTKSTQVKTFVKNRNLLMTCKNTFLTALTLLLMITNIMSDIIVDNTLSFLVIKTTDKIPIKSALVVEYELEFKNPCELKAKEELPSTPQCIHVRFADEYQAAIRNYCIEVKKKIWDEALNELTNLGEVSLMSEDLKKLVKNTNKIYTQTNLVTGSICLDDWKNSQDEPCGLHTLDRTLENDFYSDKDNLREKLGDDMIILDGLFKSQWEKVFSWDLWTVILSMKLMITHATTLRRIATSIKNTQQVDFNELKTFTHANYESIHNYDKNIPDFGKVLPMHTLVKKVTKVGDNKIKLEVVIVERMSGSHILEVEAFNPMVIYGDKKEEKRLKYVGPRFVISSSTGLERITYTEDKFIYGDPSLNPDAIEDLYAWEVETGPVEVFQVIKHLDYTYLYCYPEHFLIAAQTFKCQREKVTIIPPGVIWGETKVRDVYSIPNASKLTHTLNYIDITQNVNTNNTLVMNRGVTTAVQLMIVTGLIVSISILLMICLCCKMLGGCEIIVTAFVKLYKLLRCSREANHQRVDSIRVRQWQFCRPRENRSNSEIELNQLSQRPSA